MLLGNAPLCVSIYVNAFLDVFNVMLDSFQLNMQTLPFFGYLVAT